MTLGQIYREGGRAEGWEDGLGGLTLVEEDLGPVVQLGRAIGVHEILGV